MILLFDSEFGQGVCFCFPLTVTKVYQTEEDNKGTKTAVFLDFSKNFFAPQKREEGFALYIIENCAPDGSDSANISRDCGKCKIPLSHSEFRRAYSVRLICCFDGELLDEALMQLMDDTDYMGMLSHSFADGLDIQIISYDALEKSWNEANHSFEREHVTQYAIRHPELFNLQDFKSPIGFFGDQRWTVDEPEDYEVVYHIFNYFINEKSNENFNYKDILEFLSANPDIRKINSKFKRDEGLAKSIKNDKIIK